ncbi:retrovirus-related Pol polyprotein from transposon 412 [Trichonephila clavipes]|nr:retrovirus-related Pol polyprotein from transposon 412 [Trichonephila clavipes]
MADVQDLKSALLYALKLEATTQACRRNRQSIRGARETLDAPCESPWKRKLIHGHLAGRRLPDNEKPHYKILQIAAVNGGDKGLYVIGQINNISCRTVVDTGANVSIIRKDLAQNSQVSMIWTPPSISLQTVMDDRIQVHGKANITLRFGNIDYHHTAYIADITDPCILGLEFLKNNNFKLDFENSNMHSKFEDITLFGLQTQFESNQKIIAKTKLSLSPRTESSSGVDLSKSVIPVREANISDKTRTIQEGEVIAACAPVTCVDWKCNTQDLSSEDPVKDLLQNTDLDEKQRCAVGGLIKEFQSLSFQEHLRTLEEKD